MDAQRFTAVAAGALGADARRAERAIAATPETLAERIDRGEARDLAARLPAERTWRRPAAPAAIVSVA
jgi:uncharacterized protein (DUF2267 family)